MTDAELLAEALGLKHLDRAGWKRVGVSRPESVAAHSWSMALAALIRCPPGLDRARVLALAVLHDLAEVRVGDITPHDGVHREEKKRREREAAEALFAGHPELLALWQEADAGQTAEARYIKELDNLDMGFQAERYMMHGHDVSEFLDATAAARRAWAGATTRARAAIVRRPPWSP
ncbi:MAG: HD domain-containing protein [Deltaproteobacteria bacterium]|nr:HD domain-containing protein [Deltaproteobacteria bacterium]